MDNATPIDDTTINVSAIEDACPDIVNYEPAPESWQATVARLAQLQPLDYDLVREAEAKRLSVRVVTLDDEVKKTRPGTVESGTGRTISLYCAEAWDSPVNLAEVLDELTDAINRHMVLAPAARDAVTLWCAHTWIYQRFEHTPRLSITSPEKRCGKSSLMDVMREVCMKPLKADNISSSAVFRTVEATAPLSLFIDEADSFLGDNEELRGVLNSGFERSGASIRVVEIHGEQTPVQFATFAPVVLAGIGSLPETIVDRSVPIRLERKTAAQTIIKLRAPGARRALSNIARKLARWTRDDADKLNLNPDMPAAMGDREADICVPLVAIADAAGPAWAERGRSALLRLFRHRTEEGDNEGNGATLLADIRAIFKEKGAERLSSERLAQLLGEMEGRPWPDWNRGQPMTKNQLSRQLRPFGVKPMKLRVDDAAPLQGYQKDWFQAAWDRYCPETGKTEFSNRNNGTVKENTASLQKSNRNIAPSVPNPTLDKSVDITSNVPMFRPEHPPTGGGVYFEAANLLSGGGVSHDEIEF